MCCVSDRWGERWPKRMNCDEDEMDARGVGAAREELSQSCATLNAEYSEYSELEMVVSSLGRLRKRASLWPNEELRSEGGEGSESDEEVGVASWLNLSSIWSVSSRTVIIYSSSANPVAASGSRRRKTTKRKRIYALAAAGAGTLDDGVSA